MADYSHAYLIGDLLILPLWLLAYYHRRDLHKELLIMSLLGGCLALIFAPVFLRDYWHPLYTIKASWPWGNLEDFLNGFLVIGVASVAYEELFGKKLAGKKLKNRSYSRFVLPLLLIYIALGFIVPLCFGLWSLYSATISFLLITLIVVIVRRDLWFDALASSLIVGTLTVLGYTVFLKLYPDAIHSFWTDQHLNHYSVLGVPAGELIWALSIGAVAGPLYEFFIGRKLTSRAKRR